MIAPRPGVRDIRRPAPRTDAGDLAAQLKLAASMNLQTVQRMQRALEATERQRDDLLAALKDVIPPMPGINAQCHVGLCTQDQCARCQRIKAGHDAIARAERPT